MKQIEPWDTWSDNDYGNLMGTSDFFVKFGSDRNVDQTLLDFLIKAEGSQVEWCHAGEYVFMRLVKNEKIKEIAKQMWDLGLKWGYNHAHGQQVPHGDTVIDVVLKNMK